MLSKCIALVRTVPSYPSTAIDADMFHTVRSTILFVDVMHRHYPEGVYALGVVEYCGVWWLVVGG